LSCASTIQISRKIATIGAQSVLNVILAVSLLNEYLHNTFMQDYLANTFSSTNFILPVGLAAAVAVAGGSYSVYSRRSQNSMAQESVELTKGKSSGSGNKLSVMDTCPFCNLPLKNISENRFQCRKCRRYFKK
jgi:hypothetical protein